MRRFSILSVSVKRIVPTLSKGRKSPKNLGCRRTSSPKRSSGMSSQDRDSLTATTGPPSSGEASPAPGDEPRDTPPASGTDVTSIQSASLADVHITGDTRSEISDESDGKYSSGDATRRLEERWREMRNPPAGHVHDVFCPFWRPGDRVARPECPDRTFTLFSGNPFTRAGGKYLELWEEGRRRRGDAD